MKKAIACLFLLALAVVAYQPTVVGQMPAEDNGFAPARILQGYWVVSDNNIGGPWVLDTAQIDTSLPYRVAPGLYYTVKASSGATADTLDQVYIYGNTTPTMVGARLLDSTGVVGGTTPVWRDIHGGAAGLKYPVMARYLFFRPDNDGADATSGALAVIELFSSVVP